MLTKFLDRPVLKLVSSKVTSTRANPAKVGVAQYGSPASARPTDANGRVIGGRHARNQGCIQEKHGGDMRCRVALHKLCDSRPCLMWLVVVLIGNTKQAHSQTWSSVIEAPGVGDYAQGADMAVVNLDTNARPDIVLVAYDNPAGTNTFRYRIGWNLRENGIPERWNNHIGARGMGDEGQGAGIAFAAIDGISRPDMILLVHHKEGSETEFRYRVAWNIGTSGSPQRLSDVYSIPSDFPHTEGVAIAVTNIDSRPQPDLIILCYDSSTKENTFWYRIAWNLDENGYPQGREPEEIKLPPGIGRWSDWRRVAGVGRTGQGAGLAVAQVDSNPRPDLILMASNGPPNANSFGFRVAYNLDADGVPTAWSNMRQIAGGGSAAGAGIAVANLDSHAAPEVLFMSYHDPPGANTFRYVIGWNLADDAPVLTLTHSPLHPTASNRITIRAEARDPDFLERIDILVNGEVVRTCDRWVVAPPAHVNGHISASCSATSGPFPEFDRRTVSYGANAYDKNGTRTWSGHRAVAVGEYPGVVVPIWYHGEPNEKFDVVFIRDRDTYSSERAFLDSLQHLLVDSYLADELMRHNAYRFNIWYYKETATTSHCNNNVSLKYFIDVPFADITGIVHADDFRDCATGSVFSVWDRRPRVLMHESGHALFGLADEYCSSTRCDGGYWEPGIWPNLYSSYEHCVADAQQQGWPTRDCRELEYYDPPLGGWPKPWVSDREDLMGFCDGGFPSCAPGDYNEDRGGRRRMVWIFDKLP
jgi:hypothetical protein